MRLEKGQRLKQNLNVCGVNVWSQVEKLNFKGWTYKNRDCWYVEDLSGVVDWDRLVVWNERRRMTGWAFLGILRSRRRRDRGTSRLRKTWVCDWGNMKVLGLAQHWPKTVNFVWRMPLWHRWQNVWSALAWTKMADIKHVPVGEVLVVVLTTVCLAETYTPPPVSCASYQWKCGDGTCIDTVQRCDGHFECPDYTDETDCGKFCTFSCPHFTFPQG